MKRLTILLVLTVVIPWAADTFNPSRKKAEYYLAAHAGHYRVAVEFVYALVSQKSAWKPCAISGKGATGLMQLMPATARRLRAQDRCDLRQNVYGGVRFLAWLMNRFHGDLRLAARPITAANG